MKIRVKQLNRNLEINKESDHIRLEWDFNVQTKNLKVIFRLLRLQFKLKELDFDLENFKILIHLVGNFLFSALQ